MKKITSVWLDGHQNPKDGELRGGAVINDGEFFVEVFDVFRYKRDYKVFSPNFVWEFSEANFLGADDSSPDWYISQVCQSITAHLGVGAWNVIHCVPSAIIYTAIGDWYASNPDEGDDAV